MKNLIAKIILISILLSMVTIPTTSFAEDNLLKGAVITSNTNSADTSLLTDGIVEVTKGAECTQTRSNTYFLIDFGKEVEVNTIKLNEFNSYKTKRLYGYKVETSADGEKFKQIAELSDDTAICSSDLSETLYEGIINFNTVKTRYLKLTVRKAMDVKDPTKTAVGYTAELKAYLDKNAVVSDNAGEKTEENKNSGVVITSNTKAADTSFLTDGIINVSKGAECTQARTNTYYLYDFGEEKEVNAIKLYEFNAYKTKRLYGYKVETSADGEKFKQIAELSDDTAICSSDLSETLYEGVISFNTVKTRYLKLTIRKAMDVKDPTKTAVGYVAETEVYLDQAATPPVMEEEEDNSLYKIYVDGKKISFDVDPLMVNDRLLVPFRAICEALTMSVGWDDKEQKVTATKGANSIIMIIGNAEIGVNGVLKTSDVAPMLHNSRTVIPLRFLAEAIGCEVGWNGETNTVTITTK